MKVVTLKQPWATLIAEGIKKYEFGSWKTKYRGKILIHTRCGIDKNELDKYKNLGYEFPKSKIVACVDLVDCLELDDKFTKQIIIENNIFYGNKVRTGYAWKLENVIKINYPKEIKGIRLMEYR